MKLYVARHGRTNYNELHLCNSDPSVDVHLTDMGHTQAQDLAAKLSNKTIDKIFVSELKRTQQTAAAITKTRSVEVIVDARLNDIRTGFEDKTFAELSASLDAAPDRWTAHFNGGESIEDMKARVADFVAELRQKPYDSVLVITSEWIIFAIAAVVNGLSNEEAWNLKIVQGDYIEFEV